MLVGQPFEIEISVRNEGFCVSFGAVHQYTYDHRFGNERAVTVVEWEKDKCALISSTRSVGDLPTERISRFVEQVRFIYSFMSRMH